MAMEDGQTAVKAPMNSPERIVTMERLKQSNPDEDRDYIVDSDSLRLWLEKQTAGYKDL